MKTLYLLSDLTYPPVEGLHQQTLLTLEVLHAAGVEIDLTGYCRNPQALDQPALERHLGFPLAMPLVCDTQKSVVRGLRNALRLPSASRTQFRQLMAASRSDVIHLDGAATAGLFDRRYGRKTIVSFIDPGSRRQLRLASATANPLAFLQHLIAAVLFTVLELSVRSPTSIWHVVSRSDADFLRRRYRRQKVEQIPVMLPASSAPDAATRPGRTDRGPDRKQVRIVIFSDLRQDYSMRDFVALTEETLAHCDFPPTVDITVMGRVETAPVDLSRVTAPVRFRAWVDDYSAVLGEADIVILPDRVGTGLKNRTIQSMHHGSCVIGFASAFEGIDVEDGKHAIVCRDSGEMSSRLRSLLDDRGLRQKVAVQGQELIHRSFSRAYVADLWLGLYQTVAASGQPK